MRSRVALLFLFGAPLCFAATTHEKPKPAKQPKPAHCEDSVEGCATPAPPAAAGHCPAPKGVVCAGHGTCSVGKLSAKLHCHCDSGFLGADCSYRAGECTSQRTCADCQHPANRKFCGWCADGKYCVPKHVHKGLAKHGKACPAWHEDTCPGNRTAVDRAQAGEGYDALGMDDWGDDTSVALAEALAALIDGAAGEGTSG